MLRGEGENVWGKGNLPVWFKLNMSDEDEDEADEGGEALFGEAGDILDDKAGICGHQNKALDG